MPDSTRTFFVTLAGHGLSSGLSTESGPGWTGPLYLGKFLPEAETVMGGPQKALPGSHSPKSLRACHAGGEALGLQLPCIMQIQALEANEVGVNTSETPRIEPSARKTAGGELWILPAGRWKVPGQSQD